MAVSDLDTYSSNTGDGATLSFPITFPFITNTHLLVRRILIASPYTEIVDTMGVEFSITGGNPGTAVLYAVAPTSAYPVDVLR